MSFRKITNEEYDLYAPELKNSDKVVVHDGEKFWILKYGINSGDALQRDLLGYLLGSQVSNVAEVKAITAPEFEELRQLFNFTHEFDQNRHYLARVVGSYMKEELRWKTPEEAVASELVFSIWTRRRDAHVDNRAYIDGVPIFFDHGVAFLLEQDMGHISIFSRRNSDHGQPNRWRVKVRHENMTTVQARALDRNTQGAFHFVNDLDKFNTELGKMVSLFQSTFDKDLRLVIQQAGFTGETLELINEFLKVNLANLPTDTEIMCKIIYKD